MSQVRRRQKGPLSADTCTSGGSSDERKDPRSSNNNSASSVGKSVLLRRLMMRARVVLLLVALLLLFQLCRSIVLNGRSNDNKNNNATNSDKGGGGGGGGNNDGAAAAAAKAIPHTVVPWAFDGKGIHPARDRLVKWWTDHSEAPIGLSCDVEATRKLHRDSLTQGQAQPLITDGLDGLEKPPPIFVGRTPDLVGSGEDRTGLAYVLPFVEFQLPKVISLFFDHWSQFPPCHADTQIQDVDLVVFTEEPLSPWAKQQVSAFYKFLGQDKIGCFRTKEPSFLNLGADTGLSHLEGAAYSFYELFRLLEKHYKVFVLAEPDVAPIRQHWLPAIAKKAATLGCDEDKFWQVGSPPFPRDLDDLSGMLHERLDFHMNGNAFYALGCKQFEDYKCRVQTYYVPKDDCAKVAGCQTHEAFEGGYDHALYRFRMKNDNYEFARPILHKFAYSPFIKNLGEGEYSPAEMATSHPSTYLIHSKSIYLTPAATILMQLSRGLLKMDTCDAWPLTSLLRRSFRSSEIQKMEKLNRYIRSGEYAKEDALETVCGMTTTWNDKPVQASLCAIAKQKTQTEWKDKLPGKTYLWTMDFHGGPMHCDLPIITKAGGAVHSEIDGMCDFYGLCRDRMDLIPWDGFKGYDPTEQQIRQFYEKYKDDPEFKRVDAFLCHHPAANCELLVPFNKSIIVHATTRLEFGRHDAGIDWRWETGYKKEEGQKKWGKWITTLRTLAKDQRNIIAANNVYDQHYIKYFTGIDNVQLIPSWCGEYVGKFCETGWDSTIASRSWFPTRDEVVIVPYRSNLDRSRYEKDLRKPRDHPIIQQLRGVPNTEHNVTMMQEMYGSGNPLNLLHHPAVIIMPYQVSTIQLVELYRMNIPMFSPSLSLLKKWCQDYDLMWEVHYGWPEQLVPDKNVGVPDPNGQLNMDKHSEEWSRMFDYWIPKSDFYVFPHIHYFDSWEDFFDVYGRVKQSGGLEETNRKMMEENILVRDSLMKKWKSLLQQVKQKGSP